MKTVQNGNLIKYISDTCGQILLTILKTWWCSVFKERIMKSFKWSSKMFVCVWLTGTIFAYFKQWSRSEMNDRHSTVCITIQIIIIHNSSVVAAQAISLHRLWRQQKKVSYWGLERLLLLFTFHTEEKYEKNERFNYLELSFCAAMCHIAQIECIIHLCLR